MKLPEIRRESDIYKPQNVILLANLDLVDIRIMGIIQCELQTELAFEASDHLREGGTLDNFPGLTKDDILSVINTINARTIYDYMTRSEKQRKPNTMLGKTIEAYSKSKVISKHAQVETPLPKTDFPIIKAPSLGAYLRNKVKRFSPFRRTRRQ